MARKQTELLDPETRTEVLQVELERIEGVAATPLEEIVRWLRAREFNERIRILNEIADPPTDAHLCVWEAGQIAGITKTFRNLTGELEEHLKTRRAELNERKGEPEAPTPDPFTGEMPEPDPTPAPDPGAEALADEMRQEREIR